MLPSNAFDAPYLTPFREPDGDTSKALYKCLPIEAREVANKRPFILGTGAEIIDRRHRQRKEN